MKGDNFVGVQLCRGITVKGYNFVDSEGVQLCRTTVKGYNCEGVQLCRGTIVYGYNCVWVLL
jgi:hypothetical protein